MAGTQIAVKAVTLLQVDGETQSKVLDQTDLEMPAKTGEWVKTEDLATVLNQKRVRPN
ncbi:hypothetical protein [Novosphingobium terrae]|uniref:hypothetical protein n=1 Tax=Novosphingobium terrae TaxID=2726189 RepID=UPI001980C0CB|nr:hypothetical protein [Novosphingobium terrae]